MLGRLGDHSFTKRDWEQVSDENFGGRCAYCGKAGKLEVEHVIPINMEKLGEHHPGNVVPACRDCNNTKKSRDYAEFLAGKPDRKEVIDAHVVRHGYRPLRGDGSVRVLLQAAHDETRALADRFAPLLNELGGSNGRSSTQGNS